MVSITDQLHGRTWVKEEAGWARSVIELASDYGAPRTGGFDALERQSLTKVTIGGPLVIGHTWDADDPDAPIWTDLRDTVYPGADQVAEGRCSGCITRCSIQRHPGGALMVIEHRAGCRWLTRMLRLAGVRS